MKTALGIIVVIVLALGVWLSLHLGQTAPTSLGSSMGVVSYSCDQGKTISTEYFKGTDTPGASGQPPVPGGAVKVALSDGRNLTLKQTISADGARYSDGDPQSKPGQAGAESFVFWSKGNGATVLENNEAKSYVGCISVSKDPGSLSQVYSSGTSGFSIRYPQGYSVDASYKYQALGPGHDIVGTKFTIDPAIATGTNLSPDSYVSVEEIPAATSCSANMFLSLSHGTTTQSVMDNGTTYSFASTSDAAAGNRYDEAVYALPGTNPCIGVRYFLHYGAIGNYPPGQVDEFDRSALVGQFDTIRRTLTVSQ